MLGLYNADRIEKYASWISLVTFAVSMALIFFGDRLFFKNFERGQNELAGHIVLQDNDVRYKSMKHIIWQNANSQKNVYWGDSVFVGKNSQAHIGLKSGSHIDIGENSLVSFARDKGQTQFNFDQGLAFLNLRGKIKVKIGEQVMEVEGQNASLELKVDAEAKKGEVVLRKGKARVFDKKGKAFKLKKKTPLVIAAPDSGQLKDLTQLEPVLPRVDQDQQVVAYRILFDDLYRLDQGRPERREDFRAKAQVDLRWKSSDKNFEIQVARTPQFGRPIMAKVIDKKKLTLKNVGVGKYFWRVRSAEDQSRGEWAGPFSFEVMAGFAVERPLPGQVKDLPAQRIQLMWSTSALANQFVLEVADTEEFASEGREAFMVEEENFIYELTRRRSVFWRVRSVGIDGVISGWSEAQLFDVKDLPLLPAPDLPRERIELAYELPFRKPLKWTSVPGAQDYAVEIKESSSGQTQRAQKTNALYRTSKDLRPGRYEYRVVARDQWNRFGVSSQWKKFLLKDPRVPLPLAKNLRDLESENRRKKEAQEKIKRAIAAQKAQEERKRKRLAQVQLRTRIKTPPPRLTGFNRTYSSSFVSVSGSSFLTKTSVQGASQAAALAMLTTLRGMWWWSDHQGVEGKLTAKVTDYNEEAQNINPLILDLRYHYRWRPGLSFFNILRELQISLFGGFEYYRNSVSSDTFVPGYEIVKLGATVHFPLWQRWETGGEMSYGFGLDTSRKLEMLGFLNYYFRPRWSLGLGYRLNLFAAGSIATSPDGVLPFAEAFGEAFGNMKMSF